MTWHLITCEYPPQFGGVSDYTHLVAQRLAAEGEEVHVWCPFSGDAPAESNGVVVHRELGAVSPADLYRVGRMLNQFPEPRRLLVQWVPQGYGYRSVNLPFCLWLWKRSLQGDQVEMVVHEAFLGFGKYSWKQNAAAGIHRIMITLLMNAACRVWMTIPIWESLLKPYALGRRIPFHWLPVPSNVPVIDDPSAIARIREQFIPKDGILIGHFGTYGSLICTMLMEILPRLLEGNPNTAIVLLGKDSQAFREQVTKNAPALAGQIHATGCLSAGEISRHISACDLMIQPYPDGISTRRTSAMVALAHGRAMVTTSGCVTEPVWIESRAVALTPAGEPDAFSTLAGQLLERDDVRRQLGRAAWSLYAERFDVSHTVAALRSV
jgi:glycosyltransferase involved in cell wall biosynthesis